jgi:predicted dehydrogenase
VDESFTGLLRFRGDVTATIHCSFAAAYRTWLEIGGGDGVIRVPNPFKPGPREEIEVCRGDGVQRIAVEGSTLLFVRQVEDFVAAVLDGREPAISLQESRGVAATLAALHRSAQLQRPIQL